MPKVAVVYKTKYGSAEQYANWIREELDADLYEIGEANTRVLLEYDSIIYCGGIYESAVYGFSAFTKKHYESINHKNVVLVGVGASSDIKKSIEGMQRYNLNEEMYWKIKSFYIRGRLDYSIMSKFYRFKMFMLKKVIESKKLQDEDSLGILATYGKKANFVEKESVEPIVHYVKAVSKDL